MPAVVTVESLRKAYGPLVAVDDVSFSVQEGEIFGLLGPNGAGKTTTMECVEGVRQPDAGRIRVLGEDPGGRATGLQNRIGVQLQEAQLQKRIKVWEAVDLWRTLFPVTVDGDALLEELGLGGKRDSRFMNLSGGQKQRLFIALALINDPELVFLDELTTGLDPQARRKIWQMVLEIRERGKTVFLTTHLMEEAERLCDRVAVIEHGRLIELGTAAELVARHCPERTVHLASDGPIAAETFAGVARLISFEPDPEGAPGPAPAAGPPPEAAPDAASEAGRRAPSRRRSSDWRYRLRGSGPDFVSSVIGAIAEHAVGVTDFRTETPTLEDVFLRLTGHSIRD